MFRSIEYEDLKEVPFFNKTAKANLLLEIIDYYGVTPYLWSQLIYDKSKGNDFEKIEKILKKYGIKYDKKISVGVPRKWVCGIIPKEWNDEISAKSLTRTNTVLTIIDEECGNQLAEGKVERLKIYGKKLEEYFSKEKIEKIRDEIKPYYNQEDFTILFCYWVKNEDGFDEKYIW